MPENRDADLPHVRNETRYEEIADKVELRTPLATQRPGEEVQFHTAHEDIAGARRRQGSVTAAHAERLHELGSSKRRGGESQLAELDWVWRSNRCARKRSGSVRAVVGAVSADLGRGVRLVWSLAKSTGTLPKIRDRLARPVTISHGDYTSITLFETTEGVSRSQCEWQIMTLGMLFRCPTLAAGPPASEGQ